MTAGMEIFLVSFGVFLAAGVALALGQFFGQEPISGRCRPRDDASGCCMEGEVCCMQRVPQDVGPNRQG
jgi:hypothetical protein